MATLNFTSSESCALSLFLIISFYIFFYVYKLNRGPFSMLDLNRVCMVELDVYMNTRNITKKNIRNIKELKNLNNREKKIKKYMKHDDNEVRRRTK